jgi:hypothetical protein
VPSKPHEPRPELLIDLLELNHQIEELMPIAERWQLARTPVLPCSWPPSDRCVQVLFYRSAPLPTGTVQFRYEGPVSVVRCLLPSKACSSPPWEGTQDEFVETQWSHVDVPGQAAQESLIQIVLAGGVPAQVPGELTAYSRWFHQRGGLGESVRSQLPEFSAWVGVALRQPG